MDSIEIDAPTPHLAEPNAAQRAATTYGIPGDARAVTIPPLLIVADAGTGKTKMPC